MKGIRNFLHFLADISILVSVFRRFARKKCTKNTLDFGYNHHTQDAGMCQSTVQYLKPKCDNVKIS